MDRTEAVGAQITGGIYRQHTRGGQGVGSVDGQQARMHVGGAHKCGMDRSGQVEIVDVTRRAGKQRIVLQPAHRLADAQLPRTIQDGNADGAPSSHAWPCT